jgi:hypothetical protein
MSDEAMVFCKKCNAHCDTIKEKYLDPIIETRKWDGENYELTESNFDSVGYVTLCGVCGEEIQDD